MTQPHKLSGGHMERIFIVMNEQHSIMESQEELLVQHFGDAKREYVKIPATGLTHQQQLDIVNSIDSSETVVFVSPVPLMLVRSALNMQQTYLFANEGREKKELPNGKIIFVVPRTGWELIKVN